MATSSLSPKPLTVGAKLAYGAGDVGAAIVTQVTGFFLTAFLLDVARLPALMISAIVLLSNLWDAITDPIVGNLSDRTRTRWGRRRPWLLFGAVPFGLAFLAQWYVPPMNQAGLFVYYLIVALLLKTAFTVVNIPYTAMTPDLARGYDERTSLTSFRFGFSIIGGLAAVVAFDPLTKLFTDITLSYLFAGGVLGLFVVLSALMPFFFNRENDPAPQEAPIGIIAGLRVAFANRPFVYVVGIYLLSWIVILFVQSNLQLYVRYWLNAEDQFTVIVLALQVTSFACLGIWSTVSSRVSKKAAYYLGTLILAPALFALFFVQPGQVTLLFVLAFVAGMGVSALVLLPWSMLPDVIEWDELRTGVRREGIYYGLFVFIQKIGLSLALAIANFVLGQSGYINPAQAGEIVAQPSSVLLTLRLFVSFIPLGVLLLSLPLAFAYPITREKFLEIRQALSERT